MAGLTEDTQVGLVESWEELIAIIEPEATPFTSLLPKANKTSNNFVTSSKVKKYRNPRTKGVEDNKDATDPTHTGRDIVDSVIQKTWDQPAVGDIIGEMDVHGENDQMDSQIEDSLVVVKRSIEASLLSDRDCKDFESAGDGYRTRGAFSWLDTDEQDIRPVPAAFRPGGQYTGTLADFQEAELREMALAASKERKGPAKMLGIVGSDLRDKFDTWLSYRETLGGKQAIQSTNQNASDKVFVECVDRIKLTSCEIDLLTSHFLRYGLGEEAEESAGTHLSGLFVVKDMWRLDYTRAPRVLELENRGGGERAVVDAIFMLRCLNPLGHFSAKIDS